MLFPFHLLWLFSSVGGLGEFAKIISEDGLFSFITEDGLSFLSCEGESDIDGNVVLSEDLTSYVLSEDGLSYLSY